MTAIAAPRVGFARPKSNRWADGDALIRIPNLGEVIAHGLKAQYDKWMGPRGIDKTNLYGQATQQDVLTAVTGGTALSIAGCFLALVTTAVTTTDTSASIVEANYTGYARVNISGSWAAASGTNPASKTTNAIITFGNATAGSSVVIGYAACAVSGIAGVGRLNFYGTCTSVTINTTQTPPTIASGALSVSQT